MINIDNISNQQNIKQNKNINQNNINPIVKINFEASLLQKHEHNATPNYADDKFDNKIEAIYKDISSQGSISSDDIKHKFMAEFGHEYKVINQAFWGAYNIASSKNNIELSEQFKSLATEKFINNIVTEPPKDRQSLKSILRENFTLNSRSETALWVASNKLQSISIKEMPSKIEVQKIVREELGFLIMFNSMIKNMIHRSIKPEKL